MASYLKLLSSLVLGVGLFVCAPAFAGPEQDQPPAGARKEHPQGKQYGYEKQAGKDTDKHDKATAAKGGKPAGKAADRERDDATGDRRDAGGSGEDQDAEASAEKTNDGDDLEDRVKTRLKEELEKVGEEMTRDEGK